MLSSSGELISPGEAGKNPYSVASANWMATSLYIAKKFRTGILIDIGSTTTDIIPIENGKILQSKILTRNTSYCDGKILAKGINDLERLQNDELLYTGALRTNVAAIADSVPVNGKTTRIASEFFANTADVYRISGDITEKQYSCETANGGGKGKKDCMERLARIVCSDMNTISEKEIRKIANYLKGRQIAMISDSIKKISKRHKTGNAIIAGTGRFLAKEAVRKAGIGQIIETDIDPSLALAFMIKDNPGLLKSQPRN